MHVRIFDDRFFTRTYLVMFLNLNFGFLFVRVSETWEKGKDGFELLCVRRSIGSSVRRSVGPSVGRSIC